MIPSPSLALPEPRHSWREQRTEPLFTTSGTRPASPNAAATPASSSFVTTGLQRECIVRFTLGLQQIDRFPNGIRSKLVEGPSVDLYDKEG